MAFEVETRTVDGTPTAIGSAGPYTVVIDRPAGAGGGGLGFNGGELLHLAVAGCVSNDLFREARAAGITLHRVRVRVQGDFTGDPAVSSGITYEVDLEGDAPAARLQALATHVDAIAEIPNSLRHATPVHLTATTVSGSDHPRRGGRASTQTP